MAIEWALVIGIVVLSLLSWSVTWRSLTVIREVSGLNLRSSERERTASQRQVAIMVEKMMSPNPDDMSLRHIQEAVNKNQVDLAMERAATETPVPEPRPFDDSCEPEEAQYS